MSINNQIKEFCTLIQFFSKEDLKIMKKYTREKIGSDKGVVVKDDTEKISMTAL